MEERFIYAGGRATGSLSALLSQRAMGIFIRLPEGLSKALGRIGQFEPVFGGGKVHHSEEFVRQFHLSL